ncbi:MAG TPA: ABC transporter substrate-binding protein [Stellaceae bacterium]|nr:ABC transporter substrate-binding protein [Stellaceae bacterium]
MKRRDLMLLVGGAIAATRPARARQGAMPVIGYLSGVSRGAFAERLATFHDGLGEAGFAEGRNVAIEYLWAEGHYDRLRGLAAELVARNVDVIAASGGPHSAPAAKSVTSTIPIVFVTGIDPVAAGLVASLARPGDNVTGYTMLVPELMEKRLELLSELVPQVKTIALLVNPNNPNSGPLVRDLPEVARSKGLRLEVLRASTEGEIDAAFAALKRLQAKALLAGTDAFFDYRREQITALASRDAVPAIYDTPAFIAAGGLMTYGPTLEEGYRLLGIYVGKVLRGAKPADLPVQQPTRLRLVINLKTAKALGLTVPPSILARADELIE